MSYQIIYGESGSVRRKTAGSHTLAGFTAGFFLLFVLLSRLYWPAGADKLRQIILPCDPDVTAAAFSELMVDINQGDDLTDAVTAFCREITQNAENSG